MRVIK